MVADNFCKDRRAYSMKNNSADKDFSNILLYPPGDHHGIIIVKLYRIKVFEATKIFLDAMKDINPEDITTNLVIIDRNKTRIRREKL